MKNNFILLNKDECLKFYNCLLEAKKLNKHGCFVTAYEPQTYLKTKNFLLDDGVAGFSLKGGDLISVFKNPVLAKEKGYKSVMGFIMLAALENGAVTLDCYGDILADAYMKYGFLPVGKMKFDPAYNPEWDTAKFGTPDVIVLLRAVHNDNEMIDKMKNGTFINYNEIKDKLPIYDNYDQMLDDRNNLLNEILLNNFDYDQSLEYILRSFENVKEDTNEQI